MNQRIGTCSLCGGAVTQYFGAWGGSGSPQASCEGCGAIHNKQHSQYGAAYPTLPMRPLLSGSGGGSGGGVLQAEIDRLRKVNRELVEALKQTMSWIDNWSPEFTYDPDWSIDEDKARAAISKAEVTK